MKYLRSIRRVRFCLRPTVGIAAYFMAVVSAAGPAAAAESIPLGEVAGWALFDEKGKCSAITEYERGSTVYLQFDFARDSAWISFVHPAWKSVQAGTKYEINLLFTNGEDWSDTTAVGLRTEGADPVTGVRAHLEGDSFLSDFAAAGGLVVKMGDTLLGNYSLQGTGAMVARLRRCAIESYKRYPPDPFASVAPGTAATGGGSVGPARAKGNLPALVSNDDYPASALRAGEQGTVGFQLDVGTNGRVTNCVVTSSSGSAALDSATCRIMRSRARFAPARDSTGAATTDTVSSRIVWSIPEPSPVEAPPSGGRVGDLTQGPLGA